MIPTASPSSGPAVAALSPRILWFASLVFLGVFPAVVVGGLFLTAVQDDAVAMDFQQFYRAAASILRGETPYPAGVPQATWGGPYPYPPLPALAAIPLTAVSLKAAELMVMGILVAAALAIPFVLSVRDWRCYGLLLLWPPVISAIQTGNLTLFLGLAAALSWRYRDRLLPSSAAVGGALAAKLFLWPLAVWFAATRRVGSALLSSLIGAGLLIASWAAIRFDGLVGYPERLQKLDRTIGEDSYTAYIVGLDLELPSTVARALWLALGVGLVAAVVVVGRRGGERSAFILAIAASLALTPIVWLHYFALLVVVVAVARPRLGVVWFVPLAMVVTPGSGHPAPLETSATLAIAALTIALALRDSSSREREDPATAAADRRPVPAGA